MWLRKYTTLLNTTFKESLAYRFDALTSSAFSFLRIWLAFLLWKAIFGSKADVGGFTFPMMLTYYMVITFMKRLAKSEDLIWETSDEVREGTFTKYVTRPVNHFLYGLFRSLGKALFSLSVDVLAFVLWIFIFRNDLYLPENPLVILHSAAFALLGLFTTFQIHYLVALISFRTTDIAGPYFFVSNFMDFASGAFIPLALLPPFFRGLFSLTPFYYQLYYPAALFLSKADEPMARALGIVLVWNLLLLGFRKIQYRRMLRLYEGVGA